MVPGTLPSLFAPLLIWIGLTFGGVGTAYWRGDPTIFHKRPDGTLPLLPLFLLFPYHVVTRVGLWAQRLTAHFPVFHQVAPGLYLGGVPFRNDTERLRRGGVTATLDLTSEFTETPALRTATYHCIPLLDMTAPTAAELRQGAEWIRTERQAGKSVYVHCAKGVGRSATVAAAYLILSGQAQNADEAVKLLQKARPHVHLNGSQAQALTEFVRDRAVSSNVIR